MTPPFSSLLIANRGEIAVRIVEACRKLGIRSIAVYSRADAGALHTLIADQSLEIGPADASQSYLNIERIINAAEKSGAQAVHPGYGFLAENADFAEAVMAAGLVWVGPPPAAMRAMGDKAGARRLMKKAGVPVVPGYQGKDDPDLLKNAAEKIGFPLLVKAAAGGGGMGQRVVNAAGELGEAIESARREAQNAFGDGRLILEKYLPNARHIEFQVVGDKHGNLLHIFERECSLQRRRQKIVEETPSPLLDDKLRTEMGAAAVAAAGAVGYTNAGTVEFLVDPATREFYFLEMNTRIQVEHPITEMVCGIDLVQWQLRIAAGERLPFRQKDIKQNGHAIECRIYAEDPGSGFLPQAGRILKLQLPDGEGVRVDAGVVEGSEVGVHYDPLLAKLIVHADDRIGALAKMQACLRETAFLGLTANTDFLQDLLTHARVQAGDYDTRFVENNMDELTHDGALPIEVLFGAALVDMEPSSLGTETEVPDPYSPWASSDSFRIGEKR
jgi:acetyl-CoA carboxylase biotin carboxylase subunit